MDGDSGTTTTTGMDDFVTALTGTGGITADALWGAVTDVAPIIIIAVLFAFGFKMVKKVVKGISNGKAKM